MPLKNYFQILNQLVTFGNNPIRMKKIYFILVVLFGFTALHVTAQDLADLDTYEKTMKPGAQLSYDVTVKDKKYKLVLTLKKLGDEVSFTYKTSDPDNKSGTISMSNSAVSTAKALSHIFGGGDSKLDKETCLWISTQACSDITGTAQVGLKLNGIGDTVTVMGNTMGLFPFNINDNAVTLSGWELEGGNPKCTVDVLESLKLPLIYKLDIGWTMILTDIKN